MKLLLMLGCLLALSGCGNGSSEQEQLLQSYEEKINELESKLDNIEKNDPELLEEPVVSISREEAAVKVEEYLSQYEIENKYIDYIRVTHSEGNDGKMDFVSVGLVNNTKSYYNLSTGDFVVSADEAQKVYTEMMYLCNDLLNELRSAIPEYKYNLSVSFANDKSEEYNYYPAPFAYVGHIEGEKEVIHYMNNYYRATFESDVDLVEVEELE